MMNDRIVSLEVLGLSLLTLTGGLFLASCGSPGGTAENAEAPVTVELEPFTSIHMDAASPDLILRTGETYSVRYSLHPREEVEILKVVGDTLHLGTRFDGSRPRPEQGSWSVVVTVPADAQLEYLELHTAAGEISIQDCSFLEGTLESVSGPIALSGLDCRSLALKTVSSDIALADSTVEELTADSTSGTVSLSGSFGTADADTVSGDMSLSGSLSRLAQLDSISGGLNTNVPAGTVWADTAGEILLNGTSQGRKLRLEGEDPRLELTSVSGRIRVQLEEQTGAD